MKIATSGLARRATTAVASAWLQIDPRTLGLFRIALAVLLLGDHVRRIRGLSLWYDEGGLLPVQTVGPMAARHDQYSVFFLVQDGDYVAWVFGAIGLVYLALLVGYRTRLCQFLVLLSVLSLQIRVADVCNGGDFVLCALLWWTLFLPLGKRFSVDSLRHAARLRQRPPFAARQPWSDPMRDVRPVWSLAVLAALLQLSAIYFFNAVHKSGATWRDGTAIYYFVWQERILTGFGLLARQYMPLWGSKALTYLTLALEFGLPAFIMLPFGLRLTRRFAVFGVFALHTGIAVMSNLGVFSYVMMVFGLLLVSRYDWNALEYWQAKRKAPSFVYYDPKSSARARFVAAICDLDWFGRYRFVRISSKHFDRSSPRLSADTLKTGLVLIAGGANGSSTSACKRTTHAGPKAEVVIVRGLPLGGFLSRPLVWLCLWYRRHQTVEGDPSSRDVVPSGLWPTALSRVRSAPTLVREVAVAGLLVVAVGQALNENPAIPKPMQVKKRPGWLVSAVAVTRLQQGWRMFAPDAPTTEVGIVVDAETVDGRRIDPLMVAVGSPAAPRLDRVAVQPGLPTFMVSYHSRLSGNAAWRKDLGRWLRSYHLRTGRPNDELVSYTVYQISQTSPKPGESGPKNVKKRQLLAGPPAKRRGG